MITVENTKTDVRVTIPKDAVPPKQLRRMLRPIRVDAHTETTAVAVLATESRPIAGLQDQRCRIWRLCDSP